MIIDSDRSFLAAEGAMCHGVQQVWRKGYPLCTPIVGMVPFCLNHNWISAGYNLQPTKHVLAVQGLTRETNEEYHPWRSWIWLNCKVLQPKNDRVTYQKWAHRYLANRTSLYRWWMIDILLAWAWSSTSTRACSTNQAPHPPGKQYSAEKVFDTQIFSFQQLLVSQPLGPQMVEIAPETFDD